MKVALTIAGSDSGGGAGIQADLKTFHRFGVFGTTVVTAVTAQNTHGVRAWDPVSSHLVVQQLDAVFEDLPPAAVKSGMLGSAGIVEAVAAGLRRHLPPFYVLDPVMIASTGDRLLDRTAEQILTQELLPLATLVTPNLEEAERLTGEPVQSPDDMERAGRQLLAKGAAAVLVKGGHLHSESVVVDVLVTRRGVRRFGRKRILTRSTHGTGCTLSSAITASLALGADLEQSVVRALDFVHRALKDAPGLGGGYGPLNHFVSPDPV